MANERTVKTYMREVIKEHVDLDTLKVNYTTLAADACQHFDAHSPAPEFKIPEEFFDWAVEVEEEYK